ncbi:MAG: hypothetical protein ABL949_01215 [Fimbriimonadaceae bacterium]
MKRYTLLASIAVVGGAVAFQGSVNLQATTPGAAQTGHSNITGTSKAGFFKGNGSQLTFLNGSEVRTGVITLTGASPTYMIRGSNSDGSANASGIIGLATSLTGITYGVWAESKSVSGRALFGYASATSGATYGIYGLNSSNAGRAVYGVAQGATGNTYGGWFQSNSPDGVGSYARNIAGGIGLRAESTGTALQVLGTSTLSGNVAIGGGAGTYRLDVLHGGSTGALIKSSSSFSVVDIDAASGDAALRFAKAGVNQWNMRNRPADDYLEIFELGGGGSRMVIQDGTGNVGIGETANPTYKLDVLHGGSTGIRSRSSGSFSVVDIDAASGDAALRFAKAGVNQWNTRNRPADDYYEIFELGGGGSRMVIQDGTGNVGIGETTNPTYKLDVLHGGSTGIRSRSSSSFSVVDIDAQSGDAALRFAKAGVNQWNMRNDPATDNLQFFELGGGGERMAIQNATGNVLMGSSLFVTGNIFGAAKFFLMDDPRDPLNATLKHACIESDEYKNVYDGVVTTDATGYATITLPDWFDAINEKFRYQLTVLDDSDDFVLSKVTSKIENNQFTIRTSKPRIEVSWQVTGVRKDAYAKANPFKVEEPKDKAQKGKLLYDPKAIKPMGTGSAGASVPNTLRQPGKPGTGSAADVAPKQQQRLGLPASSRGGSVGG